jgi:hypothetical protein
MIPAIRGIARRWVPGLRAAAEIREHPDAVETVTAGAEAEGWSITGGALPACPIHEAVYWLDVAVGGRLDTVWLNEERARWMLMRVELAASRSNWGDEIVMARGIPFSPAEIRAMHKVLLGLLEPESATE